MSATALRSIGERLPRPGVRAAARTVGDVEQTALHEAADEWVAARLGVDRTDEKTQVRASIEGTFTRMVSAAVTLIVGIFVFAEISNSMPTPDNNQLANATDTVESTTGNAFTLGAVAIIVLVASVILALVSGFGNGMGRR